MTSYGFYGLHDEAPAPVTLASPTAPALQGSRQQPFVTWPATCRDGFVAIEHDAYVLHMSSDDGRLSKSVEWAELIRLPATTEVQKLHSKAGWMMQGFWSTLSFQRLLTKMPGTEPYNWVEITTLTGQRMVYPKNRLNPYRFIYKCDDKFLSPMHGGPLWLHCFDHYVEYGVPQVAHIRFLSHEAPAHHPSQDLGFPQTAMRVQTGNYYMVHKEHIKHLRY